MRTSMLFDSRRKCLVFLVFVATWHAEPAGKLLKLRCSFGIIGLELYRNVSEKESKRAEMPFMKSIWKCEVQMGNIG